MSREIFRKVPQSEKKALFKYSAENKVGFLVKGDEDDIVTLHLDDYVDHKMLAFRYAPGSPKILQNQTVVVNFAYGEDRYFFQTQAEVYADRIHMSAEVDIFVLQRRKSPRLEIPLGFPGALNIIRYKDAPCLLECILMDFSSGGCRLQYQKHLPLFKSGESFRGVLHLGHRRPIELDCEIKHHVFDKQHGAQTFGLQFKLDSTILENKLLAVFMDLQRELFVKWSGSQG